MLVIINPYHRSVTIDGEEVVQKILEFPNKLNHLSTISCTYDSEEQKITKVHDLHRFTSNFIQREYFFEHLPEFITWFHAEKQAQIEEEARLQKYKEDVENAINQTVQAGENAKTEIASEKDKSIAEIVSKQSSIINSITSKHSEVLTNIQESKTTVLSEITNATTEIETEKNKALEKISIDKQDALKTITSSVNKAGNYANKAKEEADRAKSYSDSMAAVANAKPATKDEIGLVQIGNGINVTEAGIISVNLPKSAKATQDEEGNPIEAIAGVVTTNNTLTNTDGELGVNLGNTLEASEDGAINVKLGNGLKVSENGSIETNLELPKASDSIPQDLAEEASAGTDKNYARSDHTHKLPVIPVASDELPLASEKEASAGESNAYARADHKHPKSSSDGGLYNSREVLTESGTYTVKVTGWHKITCIGGGGGGGAAINESVGGSFRADPGSGGGSGGKAEGYVYLTATQQVPYSIGGGGIGGKHKSGQGYVDGGASDGGTTTFMSVVATGGHRGSFVSNIYDSGDKMLDFSSGGNPNGMNGGLVAITTNSYYLVMLGGIGGGFGGGKPGSRNTSATDGAYYGAGGGGGSVSANQGGGAYPLGLGSDGGNGYQGCIIIEYFDPDKLPESV